MVYIPNYPNDTALDISSGPLARCTFHTAGPVRATTFDLNFTGPYGPPRYMSGHQISNDAHYIFFARAPVPHLDSFRAVLLLQRDVSDVRVEVGLVNQAH